MGTIRRLHDTTPRLCQPDHWRLEPVYGEAPGYLVCLVCAAGHLHHVARPATLAEARREIARFQREILGASYPIEDVATGRTILPR